MMNGHLQAWASCKRTFDRFKTLMELHFGLLSTNYRANNLETPLLSRSFLGDRRVGGRGSLDVVDGVPNLFSFWREESMFINYIDLAFCWCQELQEWFLLILSLWESRT